jgi:hypothetical protein
MVQVVKFLLSKHEALSSIICLYDQKKKNKSLHYKHSLHIVYKNNHKPLPVHLPVNICSLFRPVLECTQIRVYFLSKADREHDSIWNLVWFGFVFT